MIRTRVWMSACLVAVLATPPSLLAQVQSTPPAGSTAQTRPAAPVDPMALLKAVPADATAFVAIRNLQEVDADVNGIVQQLGLPPGLVPSLLDMVRMRLGLSQGLSENGGIGIVVLNLADVKTAQQIEQKVVVLLPSSAPDAMIQSLSAAPEKTDGLSKVTFMGQESLAGAKEKYVAIGQSADAVKAVLASKGDGIAGTISADRVKAYRGQDLFAWANPRGVSKELRQELRAGIQQMMSMGQAPPPEAAAQANAGLDQIGKILDDAQEFALSLSLDQRKGIVIGWYAKMREGTDTAKQTAAVKGSEKSLLVGLPNEPAVVAFGVAGAAGVPEAQQQIRQMWDNIFDTVGKVPGGKIDAEKLAKLKEPLIQLTADLEMASGAVTPLPPENVEGLIALQIVAQVKNSQKWREQARGVFMQLKEIVTSTAVQEGQPEEKVKGVADAIQWKENAEQLAGTSVDHFVVDIDKIAGVTKAEGEAAGAQDSPVDEIKTVLGKEGVLVRVGAVGNDRVIFTFGGGPKRFEKIVAGVKEGGAPLSANADLKKIADRLPEGPRVMEGYLSLSHLLTLISNIAMEVGQPLPIPAMRDGTPIAAVSVKVGDTAQYTEILVPTEVINSVKEAMGPLFMMMMGGMQQPGQDAPAPPQPRGELN